jgi:hypothetical protein
MNAYGVLSYSSNENGLIPLSELKCYEENFGLIGSFNEFVIIIYAISDAYAAHIANKDKPKKETVPTEVKT